MSVRQFFWCSLLVFSTLALLTSPSFACTDSISVHVTSPGGSGTYASPVRVTATATSACGYPITGYVVYSNLGSGTNYQNMYQNHVSSLDAWVILPFLNQNVFVRAWDSQGTFGSSSTYSITSSGTVIPTPLAGAVTFSNIDDGGGWGDCGNTSCAGGTQNATVWFAQNVSSPSRDGASIQLDVSGASGADGLFWNKVGQHNTYTNFLWDFWFYLSSNTSTANAIELDMFQFANVNGGEHEFMFGSQCNYTKSPPVWDAWNQVNHTWVTAVQNENTASPSNGTPIYCPNQQKFTTGAWHHAVYFLQRKDDGTLLYGNVTIDNVTTQWNITAPMAPLPTGWTDNLGVQHQLDIHGASPLDEWVDSEKLTIWPQD